MPSLPKSETDWSNWDSSPRLPAKHDNAVIRQRLVYGFGLRGGQTSAQVNIEDLGGEGLADGMKIKGHLGTP